MQKLGIPFSRELTARHSRRAVWHAGTLIALVSMAIITGLFVTHDRLTRFLPEESYASVYLSPDTNEWDYALKITLFEVVVA